MGRSVREIPYPTPMVAGIPSLRNGEVGMGRHTTSGREGGGNVFVQRRRLPSGRWNGTLSFILLPLVVAVAVVIGYNARMATTLVTTMASVPMDDPTNELQQQQQYWRQSKPLDSSLFFDFRKSYRRTNNVTKLDAARAKSGIPKRKETVAMVRKGISDQAGIDADITDGGGSVVDNTMNDVTAVAAKVLAEEQQDPSSASSLAILMDAVVEMVHRTHTTTAGDVDPPRIPIGTEWSHCTKRYGFHFTNQTSESSMPPSSPTYPRRIFAGSLLADDSWHVLLAHALESYGMYHTIVFVESNQTQQGIDRPLRFGPGSNHLALLQSGIFGPHTHVHVGYFSYYNHNNNNNNKAGGSRITPLLREHMQRERILELWKELGIEPTDIALLMDADETFSRDFLLAIQYCDIPTTVWAANVMENTCRRPVLRASSIFFEGTPRCIHQDNTEMPVGTMRQWNQPAMIIGECVEGIGQSNVHAPRQADTKYNRYGHRQMGYGLMGNWSAYHAAGIERNNVTGHPSYPLYNGADFRKMTTGWNRWHTGYHFHNFFTNPSHVRWKYFTYGHRHAHAMDVPLGAMNRDLNLLVKCVMDRDDRNDYQRRIHLGPRKSTSSSPTNDNSHITEMVPSYGSLRLLFHKSGRLSLPVAFQLEGYVECRHKEIRTLIARDEEVYGRADGYTGKSLYNPKTMLTHLGTKQTYGQNYTQVTLPSG